MNIEHKLVGSTLYFGLSGELDESCAAFVRDTLDSICERNQMKKVIIDMERLNFMDSTGIGVLIGRYRKLKTRAVPILIASPPGAVDRVLKLTGIYAIMPKIAE